MIVLLKKQIVSSSEIDEGWADWREKPLVFSHKFILREHVAPSIQHRFS